MTRRKDPCRKAARRAAPKPVLDDDLVELAVALAQYEIDEGCGGWLKMPWKDGWNAAQFALDLARDVASYTDRPPLSAWLQEAINGFSPPRGVGNTARRQEAYWEIQAFLEVTSEDRPMFRAAMRCAQVMLTYNGAGDGTIFNAILSRPLTNLGWAPAIGGLGSTENLARWSGFMEDARCRDALSIEPSMQNDANDWLRRAFRIAWRRRLYVAAYALPPAVVPRAR